MISVSDFRNGVTFELDGKVMQRLTALIGSKNSAETEAESEPAKEEKPQENNDLEGLKAKAKAAGIKNWYNKKAETLIKELESLK